MSDVTWLPVRDLEGSYEVSSDGRVRSLDRVIVYRSGHKHFARGRELKAFLSVYGYPRVTMSVENRKIQCDIHRLMCSAFHGRPQEGHVVRHLNGVRTDNRPDNLSWGTPLDNAQDMMSHGTHAHLSKTHCPKGHLYDEANTHFDANGYRHCRHCGRLAKAAQYRRDCGPWVEREEFTDRFQRSVFGMTVDEIARTCKASKSTARRWRDGTSAPHPIARNSVLKAVTW